jgi:choline dehydrogenase-like flavoprotein
MNIVIGSGPSGVSAAKALLDLGLPVTMLDIGKDQKEIDTKTIHRKYKNLKTYKNSIHSYDLNDPKIKSLGE